MRNGGGSPAWGWRPSQGGFRGNPVWGFLPCVPSENTVQPHKSDRGAVWGRLPVIHGAVERAARQASGGAYGAGGRGKRMQAAKPF